MRSSGDVVGGLEEPASVGGSSGGDEDVEKESAERVKRREQG